MNKQEVTIDVTALLRELGVPAHIKGYHYLREAIVISVVKPESALYITKQIYPTIAEMYKTTDARVERAIRHAIEISWQRADIDKQQAVFGYTVDSMKGKPTNSEYIALVADELKIKGLKNELRCKNYQIR